MKVYKVLLCLVIIIFSYILPVYADDENFDKVIKDIKAEHNDYLKTLLQQNVKSTSPYLQKDSNNTSNETRDKVLAKVGIRTK